MPDHFLNSHSPLSDREIISLVKKKQPQALEELYDRHAARLYGLALKMLNDQAKAEEALRATFTTIWDRAREFDSRHGSVRNWLMLLCRDCCLAMRGMENGNIPHSEIGKAAFDGIEKTTKGISSEIGERAIASLKDLPDEQRRLIELAFFKGMTQSQIARTLNMPLDSVKNCIRVGIQKLRHELDVTLELS